MNDRILLISFAALLICGSLVAADGEGGEEPLNEAAQVDLVKQHELHEIALQLTDPEAERRDDVIHRLIHLASTHPVVSPDVRGLLIRATGVPDRRLADLAEKALYLFESRDRRGSLEPELPDEVLIARAQRRDLEQARQALAGPSSDPGERRCAVQTLIHLAFSAPALSDEVSGLLERLRSDSDFTTAHLAEKTLARRQGRAMDPALVPPVVRSLEQTAHGFPREPDPFAELLAESPNTRLNALELVLDSALSENRRDDPKVIDAVARLLADPDPRVARRAGSALLGLAGDEAALGNGFSGESVNDPPAWVP